jgi:hypothetical protein
LELEIMEPETERPQGLQLTPQQLKSRRQRNVAIGLAVGFFVLLFYVVTIAKLGPGVLNRPL